MLELLQLSEAWQVSWYEEQLYPTIDDVLYPTAHQC